MRSPPEPDTLAFRPAEVDEDSVTVLNTNTWRAKPLATAAQALTIAPA